MKESFVTVTRIAESLFASRFEKIVRWHFEEAGIRINCLNPNPWDIELYDTKERHFFTRVALLHSLGLAEEWALENFFCQDIAALNERLERHFEKIRWDRSKKRFQFSLLSLNLPKIWIWFQLTFSNPQKDGDRAFKVGREHYDYGNDWFKRVLGSVMMYTGARFPNESATLEKAQRYKLQKIGDALAPWLEPGKVVLEVGCGFGELAAYLAERFGVRVECLTVSKEQASYIRVRYKPLIDRGLMQVFEMTYQTAQKKLKGRKYAAAVSIGMFEHVGPKNHDLFFLVNSELLEDGHPLFLETITSRDGDVDPFIWFHIFPGGVLPKEEEIARAYTRNGFVLERCENIGYDYGLTTEIWRKNLMDEKEELLGHYKPWQIRIQEFYLAACGPLFKERWIQNQQYLLVKGGTPKGYRPLH